jgi:uncharacterized protein involved in exopolysaccharide biosynthesis
MLRNSDLLQHVVKQCGLASDSRSGDSERALQLAVRELAKNLTVRPLRKTNIIEVAYTATDPSRAKMVLQTLITSYLQAHVSLHRTPGAYKFFKDEAQNYEAELSQAQTRLDAFKRKQGVVLLPEQKTLLLKRVVDTEQALSETSASLADTRKRMDSLITQLASADKRVVTQARRVPNQYSVERLHTMLAELRNRRTELLTKYRAEDRLIADVDSQIADTSAALENARGMTSVEQTTDLNPITQSLEAEMSRAALAMAGLNARRESLITGLSEARSTLSSLDSATRGHNSLTREIAHLEELATVASKKREEARISDSLDEQKFANVGVMESPNSSTIPVKSNGAVYFLAGCVLALGVSIALAFVLNATRTSFETVDELRAFTSLPIVIDVPLLGGPAPFSLERSQLEGANTQ